MTRDTTKSRVESWPRGTWHPPPERIDRANITAVMREVGVPDFDAFYQLSVEFLEQFLSLTIHRLGIRFRKAPSRVLDCSKSVKGTRFLVDATLNIVESCFNAAGEDVAIVFSSPGGKLHRWSYRELREMCHRVSNGIINAGFVAGDAIALYMPMTPESVAIYLGIIQAGCVVVSIADSFSPEEVAKRLHLAGAKGIFTYHQVTRGGKRFPLYERVVAANAPRAIVLLEANEKEAILRSGDIAWNAFLDKSTTFDPRPQIPDSPINILFSSGTTGEPKAIPYDHTTPIKCAMDGFFHHDLHPGEVVAWPTNMGWMMGPWLVFAALINRGTIALYHDAPTERGFGEFIRDAKVNMLGVVPTHVRRWRESGCMDGLDWSAIQTFSSTGECSTANDMIYLMQLAGGKPVIEYCGGTEIGGGFITSTVVQPNIPGAFSTPALGSRLIILDEEHRPADIGELFLIPAAIGLSRRLVNGDHDRVYYSATPAGPNAEVLRRHGDQFERLPNGYYRALGRADDTMNLGGIKISSAEIERCITNIDGLKESAAVSFSPPDGGPSQLVIFVVVNSNSISPIQFRSKLQKVIAERLNPLFRIHDIVVVSALPRTASQKVMRRKLRESYTLKPKSQK